MRELIYLSDRKLQQFVSERPRRWWNKTGVEAEVRIPLVGQAKLSRHERDRSSSPDLDRVIRAIEESERAARWFEDDVLSAGQWVHFESRMNYTLVDGWDEVVFFVDYKPDEQPKQWHDQRLLLHGSAGHLLGRRPSAKLLGDYGSQWFAVVDFGRALWAATQESLNTAEFLSSEAPAKGIFDHGSPAATAIEVTLDEVGSTWSTEGLIWRAFYGIARNLGPATAAWMAGYARITSVVILRGHRLITATPLYVEYVSPPQ